MNRIKDLRIKNGWRQEDLAARLHTRQQTVGNYETGYRSLDVDTIHKLCDIFGCSADYLLGFPERGAAPLPEDEAALLEGYRALSPEGKEYVRHSLALAALAHAGKNGAVPDLETAE